MKKTLISLLLVLALVLCFALVAAPAAEATAVHPHDDATQNHCSCGKAVDSAAITGHTHAASAVTWEVWPGNENIEEGHYYYLDKDYTSNELLFSEAVATNFTLCLNGYNLTQTARVSVRGKMTICDCSSTPGTITTSTNSTSGAGGVAAIYGNGDVLNLFNTNLVHAAGKSMKNGGGVYIYAGATFNMFSGSVSGGAASNNGGNVYVCADAAFNMYGGSVSGGSANSSSGSGGNVFVAAEADFNMYGGMLCNGTDSLSAKNGANLYSEGDIYITGNSVIEGGNAQYGGSVRVGGGTFTMDSGEIRGGEAKHAGGNLYVLATDTYLKGTAVIKDGTAGTNGGNIMMQSSTDGNAFNLQENAKIMGGTAPNGANVFCHASNASTFNMSGGAVVNGAIKNGGAGTINITGGFLELAEDFTANIATTNDLIIDLNGKKLSGAITGTKTLYIADSTAAEAGTEGSGLVASDVLVNFNGRVAQGDALPALAGDLAGQRFVSLTNEAGSMFAHRIYIGITDVKLVLDGKNVGMGYTTGFKADEIVAEKINEFGIEVYLKNGTPVSDSKAGSEFVAGTEGNKATAHVTGILKDGTDKTHLGTEVCAKTFIVIDGTKIYSNEYAFSLQTILQKMDAKASELPAEAAALLAEIEGYYGAEFYK